MGALSPKSVDLKQMPGGPPLLSSRSARHGVTIFPEYIDDPPALQPVCWDSSSAAPPAGTTSKGFLETLVEEKSQL